MATTTSSSSALKTRAELDKVYLSKKVHPGKEFQFWMVCQTEAEMVLMAKGFSKLLSDLRVVNPAYSKDGSVLNGYFAVFTKL